MCPWDGVADASFHIWPAMNCGEFLIVLTLMAALLTRLAPANILESLLLISGPRSWRATP